MGRKLSVRGVFVKRQQDCYALTVMPTPISDFDYILPPEFIAQTPLTPRDSSKLLVMDRESGEMSHRIFSDIVELLQPDDVLVFNTSKVFNARLQFGAIEVFVLRIRDNEIDALVRPGKKIVIGRMVDLFLPIRKREDGVVTFQTQMTMAEMLAYCEARGSVPTPPYVTTPLTDVSQYQTVYAKDAGSVAAPTAGLHFTPALLERIRAKGVQMECVTLHVGIGTFRPMQSATIEEHVMHSEWVSVDDATAQRIVKAKKSGRRIIAVGTTTVRVLEGVTLHRGQLEGYTGEIDMFITPGFSFRIVDGLITNFHLPKSTLLVLVSAFAGREHVRDAYEEAKCRHYRFFSFGDAVFIA